MNINPVSFKGITRIRGNNPMASADRISDVIKNDDAQTSAESAIGKYINLDEAQNQATVVTFDKYKTAYVVTGEECKQLKELYDDMAFHVENAAKIHGRGSDFAKRVQESELDRYIDLSKMIVMGNEDATLFVNYDHLTNNIATIDYIV